MKLDSKFHGVIVKNKDNSIVPDDQWVLFLAKDNAFPATLEFYIAECERLGAEPMQLDSAKHLLFKVKDWRARHPQLCKVPDTIREEIE